MTSWIGIVLLVLVIALALLYNRLVRSRNKVNTAWSDIDVQLQRRHDLIPNIVKAVKIYADYERKTFEAVTELRSQAIDMSRKKGSGPGELGDLEEKLGGSLIRLIAVAENYPDLKADENFQQLQNELVRTENVLQLARRYYNGSVRNYNTITETVPSNFVANWFGFRRREFFQKTSDDVDQAPKLAQELDK